MAGQTPFLRINSTLFAQRGKLRLREDQEECVFSETLVEGGPMTRTQVSSSSPQPPQTLLALRQNERAGAMSSTREEEKSAGAIVS